MQPCLLPEGLDEFSEKCLISLPQPFTGQTTLFYLPSAEKQELYQVSKLNQSKNSFFYGNWVGQDASLVILTPIDPLFVLIPLFEQKQADQGKAMFMSLEDLFHHDSVPDLPRLLTSLEHLPKSLERICAVTEAVPGEFFYKLDESKVLDWLSEKVNRILEKYDSFALLNSGTQFGKENSPDKKKNVRLGMICGLLSDYLSEDWMARFKKHLGLKEMTGSAQDPALYYNESQAIQKRSRDAGDSEGAAAKDAKKAKPASKMSNAQKSLAKVSKKGMKNISSFFGKK